MQKIALLFLLLVLCINNVFSQSKEKNDLPLISKVFQDSTYNIPCYYTDVNGEFHYFEKIVFGPLAKKGQYKFYTWNGDSLSKLEENWCSIGFYSQTKDSIFYEQKLKVELGGTFTILTDKEFIKTKYWLGEGISDTDKMNQSRVERRMRKKGHERKIVFSNDINCTAAIWCYKVSETSGYGNSYSGTTPGNSSASLYSGSGSAFSKSSSLGGYNRFQVVIGDSIKDIFNVYMVVGYDKILKGSYQQNYDRILEALQSNIELSNIYKEEFQKAVDRAIEKCEKKKIKPKWVRFDHVGVLTVVMDCYYEKYLVHFGVSR